MNLDEITVKPSTSLTPSEEQKVTAALSMLKQGTDRQKIISLTGFSSQQLDLLEQRYYDSRGELDERAMRIKQMDRLDALLNAAWELVDPAFLRDDKGSFGQNISALVTLLREMSELAGLKKKQVQTEVRIIEESQTQAVVAYVNSVVAALLTQLEPLLTKNGQRQLEKNRDLWLTEAVSSNARLLEGTVEVG